MAHVRFLEDFDYQPKPNITIAYLAGRTYHNVRRECMEKAVRLGKAVEIKPRKVRANGKTTLGG